MKHRARVDRAERRLSELGDPDACPWTEHGGCHGVVMMGEPTEHDAPSTWATTWRFTDATLQRVRFKGNGMPDHGTCDRCPLEVGDEMEAPLWLREQYTAAPVLALPAPALTPAQGVQFLFT